MTYIPFSQLWAYKNKPHGNVFRVGQKEIPSQISKKLSVVVKIKSRSIFEDLKILWLC